MVFHWSLSDCKSILVSQILLRILNNSVVIIIIIIIIIVIIYDQCSQIEYKTRQYNTHNTVKKISNKCPYQYHYKIILLLILLLVV